MDPERAATGTLLAGVLALVAASTLPHGILHKGILARAGLVYAATGSLAFLSVRRGGISFGPVVLTAVTVGAIAGYEPTLLARSEGGLLPTLWRSLTLHLHSTPGGGLSWGLATTGTAFAFALGLASRPRDQWIAVGVIALATTPLVAAVLPILRPGTFIHQTAAVDAVLGASLAIAVAIPLHRLGASVRRSVGDHSPPATPVLVAGGLVCGLQLLAVGVVVTVHSTSVLSVSMAAFAALTLGPVLFIGGSRVRSWLGERDTPKPSVR